MPEMREERARPDAGPQFFISHCTADQEMIVEPLVRILRENMDPGCRLWCNSTRAGEKLSDELRNNLRGSDLILALITDSYLRSSYCMAELSGAWILNKALIPVLLSAEAASVAREFSGGEDRIRIEALRPDKAEENADRIADRLVELGLVRRDRREQLVGQLSAFFAALDGRAPVSDRHYIGCSETEKQILDAVRKDHLDRLSRGSTGHEPMTFFPPPSQLSDVYVVVTTGMGLIHRLKNHGFLKECLLSGVNVHMLIPDRGSDFCGDVAAVEQPGAPTQRAETLKEEFTSVISDLREAWAVARNEGGETPPGKIFVGCCFTLLRQTIMMAVEHNGDARGWVTFTIPPKKADGTFTMDFHGSIGEKKSFAAELYEHVTALETLAKERDCWLPLAELDGDKGFGYGVLYKDEWTEMARRAKDQSYRQEQEYQDLLIEVAAQHPLTRKGGPGAEFRARLDRAVELYRKWKAADPDRRVLIYVPGSVHLPDTRSLSDAGCEYLIGKGIDPEDVCGEDRNQKYMGEDGVYNSSDECYVAAQIFYDEDFGQLHCVCGEGQVLRKELFYYVFGVDPRIHSVPVNNPHHNPMYEILEQIPYVLRQEHDWTRNPSGRMFRTTRRERKPDYQE